MFSLRTSRWNPAISAQALGGRRLRTVGIAAVLLVAGPSTAAEAAPGRTTRPSAPGNGVLLSKTAPRPEGTTSDELEQDYPGVDYLHLSPADLVPDLVTSLEPTSVNPDHACQALTARDNAVAVDGRAVAFKGIEASLCDPGEGSYLVWHGQLATSEQDVLASASLAVIFDEQGIATSATGTIQDAAIGYELMPVEGDTYALYELTHPGPPEGEPIVPSGDAEEGGGEPGASGPTTTTETPGTTTEPSIGESTTSTTAVPEDAAPGGGNPQPIPATPDDRSGIEGDSVADAEPGEIDGGQPRPGGPAGNRTIQVRFAYTTGMTDTQAYLYMVNRTAQTNDSFINSNMPVRIEGLGPVAAGYTQSSSIYTDIVRLGDPGDSHMDGLLGDFSASGIDALAVLVPNSNESCGRGTLSNEVHANASFLSVSAMESGCNYSLTHELGHNFSAHHNPENAGDPTAFPWSYGHFSMGKASTVMSYEQVCQPTPCPRILQWSDPDNDLVGFPNTPSGTAYRDNDRSVTDTSWAASQKGSSSSNDSIWFRSASSHTSFSIPDDAEAPYTPLSGDFDGDQDADQFWYFPGRPLEQVWAFSSTPGTYLPAEFDVVGSYRPVVGDFDGDGRDDIFWHAPGSNSDSIWWGTADPEDLGTVVSSVSVSATYSPQAGDIDGDGRDDVVWYAPGTANDYIWWGNASRSTFAGGSGSTGVTVNGLYHLTLGDHNGDGREDLSWFQPGTGSDFIWHGMASHSAVGPSNQTNYTQNGDRLPQAGDFNGDGEDDIFWYGPGSEPDTIWWGQSTMSSFASAPGWTGQTVSGTYSPTTGDFDGDSFTDLFWFSFG
ncbi:FG-GAP repeat domain-containing protein [Aquihabitans daechungensis]|uniref:FG-GAP repeat domain-containing protein n=1 Tax=Aquihabitans daechungensis TaxID=1052257 RepID=UPI003BA29042